MKLPAMNSILKSSESSETSTPAPTADGDPSQKFFQMLSEIIAVYRKTDEEMKQTILEEKKLSEKGLKTMISGPIDTPNANDISEETKAKVLEDVRKKDQHENLFGRFKNQQEASADDMISQLKARMKLKNIKSEE